MKARERETQDGSRYGTRRLLRAGFVLTTLVIVLTVAFAHQEKKLPDVNKTVLTLDGETITILRDAFGVPHVFATSRRGLFYGNGYAIAEDRLGQMELNRRTARGEMAELVGTSAVNADKETRLDGYTEAEREAQFARLAPELQELFSAYRDGVNAYLAVARTEKEPRHVANFPVPFNAKKMRNWRVTDSIAIGQMMARRFGGGEGGELRNMLLFGFLQNLHKENAWKLFNDIAWRNDPASPTTVPAGEDNTYWERLTHWTDEKGTPTPGKRLPLLKGDQSRLPQMPRRFDPQIAAAAADTLDQNARMTLAQRYGLMTKWGSYCFVVSKERSATGNPLLVGGPQMGFRTPQIACEIHLNGAGMDCIGMGFAGIPGVLIGHNPTLAWSVTSGVNDQTDTFVESLEPGTMRYRYKGQWRDMEKRTETIAVSGGEPITQEIYRTIHGPIVQWDKKNNLAYSRQASYWDKELDTFAAIAKYHTAQNIREFGDACAVVTTSFNAFCATADGDIGYWYCGRTPLRDPRIDPRLPTPGDGEHEWRGMMKFAEQPQIVNPKQGYLANWNNKPAVWWDNADTPVWGEIFHNGRILERLAAKPKLTTDDLRDIVVDIGTNDYTAQVFLPLLTDALRNNPALTPKAKTAAAILFAWDHRATEGSAAKTLFDAWLQQVREDLFLKPFGFIQVQGKDLFNTAMQPSFILHVLRDRVSPVPVQYNYLNGKMPQAVIADAWNKAVEKLAKQRGMSPSGWGYTQGQINFKPLLGIPKTDRGTYIQIIECAKNEVHGVNILPPGQNEREDSAHFGDQRELAGWFQFKPMRTKRDILEHEAEEPEGRKAKP